VAAAQTCPRATGHSANNLTIYDGQIALGTVEQIHDCYFAIDPDGSVVGTFKSLAAAVRALPGNGDHGPVNARPAPNAIAARQREIAERYARRHAPPSKMGRITSLRRTQVLRLGRHRHGATLPDNADGRAILQLLLELHLDGPSSARLATWATGSELDELIRTADDHFWWWRGNIAEKIGERLKVTFDEWKSCHLWHIVPSDVPASTLAAYKRERKRERDRKRRARISQERALRAQAKAPPTDYWDLIDSHPRAAALAGGLLTFEWQLQSDLVRRAKEFYDFRGLSPDALRQAIHRAAGRLERLRIAETKLEGRVKYVRRVPSEEDAGWLQEGDREEEALAEAAKDFEEDPG
jgi:hypothetical protein